MVSSLNSERLFLLRSFHPSGTRFSPRLSSLATLATLATLSEQVKPLPTLFPPLLSPLLLLPLVFWSCPALLPRLLLS